MPLKNVALASIALLLIGMFGWSYLEGTSLSNGFMNASLSITGLGPVNNPLNGRNSEMFIGIFALLSGILIIWAGHEIFQGGNETVDIYRERKKDQNTY